VFIGRLQEENNCDDGDELKQGKSEKPTDWSNKQSQERHIFGGPVGRLEIRLQHLLS